MLAPRQALARMEVLILRVLLYVRHQVEMLPRSVMLLNLLKQDGARLLYVMEVLIVLNAVNV